MFVEFIITRNVFRKLFTEYNYYGLKDWVKIKKKKKKCLFINNTFNNNNTFRILLVTDIS